MGIDISTYRCRVGTFVPGGGCGFMSLFITFGRVVNLLGSLALVRVLLVIAGVEQNPGPVDKYIFRYQYLLVEIGTDVMRGIFDVKVGFDFVKYLSANFTESQKLQHLILAKIITADQTQHLPPIDNSPKSTNFDITLLACLLRNVCGLRGQKDPVWKNPPPTDFSLEADLARLRECRNNLHHSGTVFISEAELTVKWNELSQILIRLNAVSGIPNLPSLINNAKKMDIDEELKNRHDNAIKAWTDMDHLYDRGIEELKIGQSKIIQTQSVIKDDQSEIFRGLSNLNVVQSELQVGQSEMKHDMFKLKQGQSETKHDMFKLKQGQSEMKHDMFKLKQGQSERKHDMFKLKQGQSEMKHDMFKLKQGQSERKHDMFKLKQGQSETKHDMFKLKQGQSEMKHDMFKLKQGQSERKHDMFKLKQGQSEMKHDMFKLKQGQSETKHDMFKLKQGQSEMKHDMFKLKQGQSEMKHGMFKLKQGQSKLKDLPVLKKSLQNVERSQKEQAECMEEISNTLHGRKPTSMESDLRNRLVKIYKEECCTLPVSPLCDEDEVDILSIYKPPSLYHVPYHRTREQEEKYTISSYKEIFCNDDRSFRKIYITGDAGVGKTSFCKRMSFLWCKSQSVESVGNKSIQNDIDFMAKFDFVFYISLQETHRKDVVTMIIEQLFCNENDLKKKELYECVENIIKKNECVIIMDAFDEWTPKESGKININTLLSDKCVFVTTCRPYKIENERLSPRDIDRQVQITGINEFSINDYVTEILNCLNKANRDNKKLNDFIRDVKNCGLQGQLHIPIITSHLVAVWLDHKLTDMSRALIYSNIVDMLLKRAEKRNHLQVPSSAESKVQFPDSLSKLFYFKKHISFLQKICLLSFNLLFKQDKCLSDLVLTTEQLESEPYCVSAIEINFLCKYGILSKSKVIGRFGKCEQKLSYLHKSYLEYFASLFVSSFDSSNAFDYVVKKWTSINDVLQFGNFFLFFVGLSCNRTKLYFENIYHAISDDLCLCRINCRYYYNEAYSYFRQIRSLQTMVINCFREVCGSNDPNTSFKLEDYNFYDYNYHDDDFLSKDDLLKQLLVLNTTCVKSIDSTHGKYYVEFDQIKNLQGLYVEKILSADYIKFTKCMLQNQHTLHTVSIDGNQSVIPELPVRSLQNLTSLALSMVTMQHDSLHNLMKFLSDNVLIENIDLFDVHCDNHQYNDYSDCTLTLNLSHHTKLTNLCLEYVKILCNSVNNSSLKYLVLDTCSTSIVCNIDVFNYVKYSQLVILDIHRSYFTMKSWACALKTLPCLKKLGLRSIVLPDDVSLQLHPDVTKVKIELTNVSMSCQSFHCFIESLVNNKSLINVLIQSCIITSDGETRRELLFTKVVEYMSKYLASIPTVNITMKYNEALQFETRRAEPIY